MMTSPITLKEIKVDSTSVMRYHHSSVDGFGDLLLSGGCVSALLDFVKTTGKEPYLPYSNLYSVRETKAALNIIRSELWRQMYLKHRTELLICAASDFEAFATAAELDSNARGKYRIETFESFIGKTRALTLEDRAKLTLQNIFWTWEEAPQAGIAFQGYMSANLERREVYIRTRPESKERGMAYGCDETTAPIMYEDLRSREWIKLNPYDNQSFLIGSKGYQALDKLERGVGGLGRSVFFVRKFDTELDIFMRPLLDRVQENLSCTINAVWEKEFIHKIDEEIFRSIRHGAVTLVDVDPSRFNVGLEAGYALALAKPIVAIMEKELADQSGVPFDIATLNVYLYRRSKPDELVQKLTDRIGLAFEIQEELLKKA